MTMDIISVITCVCTLGIIVKVAYDKIMIRLGLRKMSRKLDEIIAMF